MTNPDLAALSEAYSKSPNALSLTLLGHALVDEYRAGRLVHIDEGMRERVAQAIDHELVWSVETDVLAASLTREEQLKVADAAIAAMMGGAEHGK